MLERAASRSRDGAPEGSLGAAMAAACEQLRGAGIGEPMLDVRRLASAATGRTAAEIIAATDRPLQADGRAAFEAMIKRRAAREPVSRIVGRRGFWSFELKITPDVLDPRPETETLVETALDIARSLDRGPRLRIVDVGTGSGAVLLALLSELPSASGIGSDISPAALEVARENAQRLGLADRAAFQLADGLDGVDGPFDLLVSNPPYIETAAIAGLDAEVASFDPRLALDGGADGLDAYRAIASRLKAVVPDGWATFEIGMGQEDSVLDILREAVAPCGPFTSKRSAELSGITRVVAVMTQD